MMKSLFTTQQWETVKPAHVVYDHFFYSEREPGKVLLSNGRSSRKPCYRKAIWNGSGHCRIGSYHVREHKYDIPLKG